MKNSRAGAILTTLMTGGLLLNSALTMTASAEELPGDVALSVLSISPAAPTEDDTITITGANCVGPDGQPGTLTYAMSDYFVVAELTGDGSWSRTIGPDNEGPGTYTFSASCDYYTGSFDYAPLTFTITDPQPAALLVVPDKITAAMLGDESKGVTVQGTGFTKNGLVSVTVTDPNGAVYDLQDEGIGDDGAVEFGVYYEGGVAPLGTYTVRVFDYRESATATFTVVPEPTKPPTKNSGPTLAETGVKLDAPLAFSTGGLLVLAGAATLVFARRREN